MSQVVTLSVPSAIFGEERTAQVYLPPGYDPEERYPVIYCCLAALHFRYGLPELLEEQIASGAMKPCVAVGIPLGENDAELDLYRFAATELVPAVEAAYAAVPDRSGRWLLGYSAGAGYMLELGVIYGQLFSKVAAQAPGWMTWSGEENRVIAEHLAESMARMETRDPGGPVPDCWFTYGDAEDGFEALARRNGSVMIAYLEGLGAVVRESLVEGGHGIPVMKKGWPQSLRFLQGAQ